MLLLLIHSQLMQLQGRKTLKHQALARTQSRMGILISQEFLAKDSGVVFKYGGLYPGDLVTEAIVEHAFVALLVALSGHLLIIRVFGDLSKLQ